MTLTLKQELAQKMLDEKLDFLSLEDSYKLYRAEHPCIRITRFNWVMQNEELEDNGEGMSFEELLAAYDEIYGLDNDYGLKIGGEEEFDEFTLVLCPAYTYCDLL